MAQFNYTPKKVPCVICKKPTYVTSVKDIAYCSRICESEAKFRGRYFGTGASNDDRPKRPVGKL